MANASASLCVLLLTPSSVPGSGNATGITPPTPLLWVSPTAVPPYVRLTSSACRTLLSGAIRLSQVPIQTVRSPATDLDPGTSCMHSPLRTYRCWLPGHETLGPVQQGLFRGSIPSRFRIVADLTPFLRLRIARYLTIRPVQFQPEG